MESAQLAGFWCSPGTPETVHLKSRGHFGGLSLGPKSRFPGNGDGHDRDSVRMWRLRRRKVEYPVLPRPLRRQIGEARNPHAVRESAVNSRFDEIGCEKGERDRHIHFADAAALAFCDALRSCSCVRGKFLEPTASAGN